MTTTCYEYGSWRSLFRGCRNDNIVLAAFAGYRSHAVTSFQKKIVHSTSVPYPPNTILTARYGRHINR